MEIVKFREFHALEEITLESFGGAFERFGVDIGETVRRNTVQFGHIYGEVRRVDFDVEPIGNDPPAVVVVDQAPELGQAPAQAAARIVRDIPQEFAEMLAPETAVVQAQIREQGPRFLRRRQRQDFAVSPDLEFPEELNG